MIDHWDIVMMEARVREALLPPKCARCGRDVESFEVTRYTDRTPFGFRLVAKCHGQEAGSFLRGEHAALIKPGQRFPTGTAFKAKP